MPTWMIWTLGLGIPLAAAAVPVIIHLINLTRYRRVEWAAMEFLLAAYRRTRRRLQMESLIMLLLRVAAVILLAAALFPMGCDRIKDWAEEGLGMSRLSLSTDAPLHLVLVLDDSASMAYAQEGETSFERARQYAQSLVESLREGRDRVSIVRASDVYVPPRTGGAALTDAEADKNRQRRVAQSASLDLQSARELISATQVAAVDTNMLAALREARRLVETTPDADATALVVVSDFLDAGWRESAKDGAVHKDFVEVMKALNDRLRRNGGSPTFYDVGFENSANVAITRVDCSERIVGNGMEAQILVDVEYFASARVTDGRTVRLKYRIDGGSERPFGATVELVPNRRQDNITLKLAPKDLALKPEEEKTGASRNVEIFTEEPDALKADNSRSIVIHVVPNIPILVVNGVPHPDPDLDETFYLETALGISSSRIEEESSEGAPTRITPNRIVSVRPEQLGAMDNFLDYRMVVLANVSTLTEATVRKLEEFVEAGYGLVIFDGDQLDFQQYNRDLYKGGAGLLPVKLKDPAGNNDRNAEGYSLVPQANDHPVVRLFSESTETLGILTGPKVVRNWRAVQLPEGAEADPLRPATTVLGLNTPAGTAPLMVERSFGRGRVVYFATTAGERWNGFWRESQNGLPMFLFLEMASYLTSSEVRYSNLAVGEAWRRVLRVSDIAPKYMMRDPAGTQAEIVPTAEGAVKLIEFGGTAQPGVYTLTAMDRAEGGETRRKWQERFAVNLNARECNVRRLTNAEGEDAEAVLRDALEDLEGLTVNFQRAGAQLGEGALAGADNQGGTWWWLAIVGVSFLLLETAWSAVISKPEV
ncbi:MAG: VWA domain-containing protein [Planctomycetes bacterium]|nr:VWA domain-containing protein [Planctomycetota bacterium]